jgi:hypothetical protein
MPTQITLNQLMIVGAIVGFVLGLIPLILGFVKKNLKFGMIGFLLTLAAGTFFSLLGALPVSAVSIWLVLRKPAETKPAQVEVINQNPIDVPVKD